MKKETKREERVKTEVCLVEERKGRGATTPSLGGGYKKRGGATV